MDTYFEAPPELQVAISEFWPEKEWEHAAQIAKLESGFDAFAVHDTTSLDHPCNSVVGTDREGTPIWAELSIGYFQINACNFPGWEWQRLYNAHHNAGTAHMLWEQSGNSWRPWYFSAKMLGLV